jgi:hypothetical protein
MAEKNFDDLVATFDSEYPDTDLYFYAGRIRRPLDDRFIEAIESRKRRKNFILMLATIGGDPDAAYRMSRCIQRFYAGETKGRETKGDTNHSGEFAIFVDTECASAGTLIALGASRLILGEYAELSPLDIQIRKPDEVGERDSGLTPTQALEFLEKRSKSLFKQHFNQLRLDGDLGLTTKTAAQYAAELTTGLLAPIYGQLDPMRLGEVERLMGITAAYGERLAKGNLKSGALAKLLAGYPAHSFVIDRQEAADLFKITEAPKPGLKDLGEWFRVISRSNSSAIQPVKGFLTSEPRGSENEPASESEQSDVEGTGAGDREATPRPRPRRRASRRGGEAPDLTPASD